VSFLQKACTAAGQTPPFATVSWRDLICLFAGTGTATGIICRGSRHRCLPRCFPPESSNSHFKRHAGETPERYHSACVEAPGSPVRIATPIYAGRPPGGVKIPWRYWTEGPKVGSGVNILDCSIEQDRVDVVKYRAGELSHSHSHFISFFTSFVLFL
jgi:hypothetical protein